MKKALATRLLWVGAFTLLFWGIPAPAAAQSSPHTFSLGIHGGVGNGPSNTGALGVESGVRLTRFLSLRGEFHRWTGGFNVDCVQSWPESYRCDVGGDAFLFGVRGSIPHSYGSPYLELKSGLHVRDDIGKATENATPIQLKVGFERPLGAGWYVGLSGQSTWVLDDRYEDRMGENLRYHTLQIGFGFGGFSLRN